MKKMFTLLALLTCFLGANAKTIVDAEINFAERTDVNWVWGSLVTDAVLDIQDGYLHYSSPGLPEGAQPWDTQFVLDGLNVDVEIGQTYIMEIKIKGSVEGSWQNIAFAGNNPYGNPQVSTDWQVVQMEYVATSTTDSNPKFQCGNWAGEWWIEYIKITHEGKEEAPITWKNLLANSDASSPWDNPDAQSVNNQYDGEGAQAVSAYSKEFGRNSNNPHAADIENSAFVCHTVPVVPVIVFETDTELWGQQYHAGDPMPDNAWQNQFWINLPEPQKEGTPLQLKFKYKASKAARADIQTHAAPGNYIGGFNPGNISFTTEWQTFEQRFDAPGKSQDGSPFQSIAFNLGVNDQYKEDIVFYFDDIEVNTMVLEEGFFAAAINADEQTLYDLDSAVKLVYDEGEDAYIGVVGKEGDKDSWVNQVMISTVRGNDKAFKAGTIKPNVRIVVDEWLKFSEASQSKIDLPAKGVWEIQVAFDNGVGLIMFHQIEGEQIVVQEPVDIVTNATENVVNATERDWFGTDDNGNPKEDEVGTGQPWDNQFWIAANRNLEKGEVTVLKFRYKASKAAHTTTQAHQVGEDGKPCTYLNYAGIGDVDFTVDWQDFSTEFTVPDGDDGMRSIVFNMAEIKEACDYYITDVQWYLKDAELEAQGQTLENLIDAEGDANFWIKVNSGAPEQASGISTVVNDKKVSNVTYNLAGQRVSKDYKGIVIKNGAKYIAK